MQGERIESKPTWTKDTEPHEPATRVSVSQLETVYPFLDRLEDARHPELATLPLTESKLSTRSSLMGTALHTAQMLAMTFTRHESYVSLETLQEHYPTFPEEGLRIMQYFANQATKQTTGVDRLKAIYEMYSNAQRELFEDTGIATRQELRQMWASLPLKCRVYSFMEVIHEKMKRGELLISDPRTIMQFEVGMIPRFKDIGLQVPMSVDLLVKPPGYPVQICDFKSGTIPDVRQEAALHQRVLMEGAVRHYAQYIEPPGVVYFGDYVLMPNITLNYNQFSGERPLPFYYSRFGEESNDINFVNATTSERLFPHVHNAIHTRAIQISEHKAQIRTLLRIQKHTSTALPTSIFKTTSDNEQSSMYDIYA